MFRPIVILFGSILLVSCAARRSAIQQPSADAQDEAAKTKASILEQVQAQTSHLALASSALPLVFSGNLDEAAMLAAHPLYPDFEAIMILDCFSFEAEKNKRPTTSTTEGWCRDTSFRSDGRPRFCKQLLTPRYTVTD